MRTFSGRCARHVRRGRATLNSSSGGGWMPGRVVRFPSASRAERITLALIALGEMSDEDLGPAVEWLLDPTLRGRRGVTLAEEATGASEDPLVEGGVLCPEASQHVHGLRLLR